MHLLLCAYIVKIIFKSEMIMKKIRLLLVLLFITTALYSDSFYSQTISEEKLKMLPVPMDFRNYFFLQSIDDTSIVVIGDFTGEKRFLTRIVDEKGMNKIDLVSEYYIEEKKIRNKVKPSSAFFSSIEQIKKDIIEGKVFRDNYSYKMKSIDTLRYKLEDGADIFKYGDGYTVKVYDPDEPSSIMCEFYFSKVRNRYDLIFKTNYYKLYRLKIVPPILFSVYCKNSKDPVVAETVEELLKLVPRK